MAAEDILRLGHLVGGEPTVVPITVADQIETKVKNERNARKVDIEKNLDMYQGDHSSYFKQRRREPNEVFADRKKDAVIANYCKFIIDLSAKYAYGRPEKVRRQFVEGEGPAKTEDRMRHIEELIDIGQFMLKSKREAGISGEIPVRLIPVDENTGEQLRGKATTTVYPQPILLDPLFTFPLRNSWGKLLGIVIRDEYHDYTRNITVNTNELILEDSRWYWEEDQVAGRRNIRTQVKPPVVIGEKNMYSLAEEFVIFDNIDTKKDEIEPIINLQIKLDEALTDADHFFAKHGWPQLVTSVDLENVIYNPGYTWQVETDDGEKIMDKMGFLTWDGRPEEAGKFRRELEVMIFKIASVAPMSTGDPEAIGQLRTGAALVAAHGPSIQSATEKQVAWESNEKKLFNAIAKLDSKFRGTTVDQRFPQLKVQITFPQDFVPGEELVRAEIDSMSMNAHTTTITEIQKRKHPTATEKRIQEIRKEILEDSEELTDSKRAFVTEQKESGQPIQSSSKKSKEQKP
jgi:hypothetical protein